RRAPGRPPCWRLRPRNPRGSARSSRVLPFVPRAGLENCSFTPTAPAIIIDGGQLCHVGRSADAPRLAPSLPRAREALAGGSRAKLPGDNAMSLDLFKLTGKVALVTGGSKGLGKAMARGLAEAGADVVISSRHEDELRPALAEILAGTGRRGACIVADLSRRGEADRLARAALEQLGRVDILVNNAGTNIPQPIDTIRDADWDNVLEL